MGRCWKHTFFAVLVLLILSPLHCLSAEEAGGSASESEQAEWVEPGLFLDTNIAAAYNYLGLRWTNNLFYRFPLIKNPGMLWKSTKIELGISDELTPSYHRIFAMLAIEPIALFDLKVFAGYDIQWAALTGGIYTTPDPETITDWGSAYADVYDETTRQSGHGFRLRVMPTVKAAVGPVAATYTLTFGYHTYNAETATGYYYDAETASIHSVNDFYFTHDGKLIVRFLDFMAGANLVYMHVNSWGYSNLKLTGLFVYTPSWSFLPEELNPYFILQAGSFIDDRYFTGKFSIAGVLGLNAKLY